MQWQFKKKFRYFRISVAKPNDKPLFFQRDSSLNASSLLLLKVTLPISVKDDAKILLFKK
jgi:hypothetical protein